MPESHRVIDDFLIPEHFEEVRKSPYAYGFGTWSPQCETVLGVNSFKGVAYMGKHEIILKALSGYLGVMVFPGEMKFRATAQDATLSYVHSDRSSGQKTAIVYLSDEKDVRSGTGFYRYKPNDLWPSGLSAMPPYEEFVGTPQGDRLTHDMAHESPEDTSIWELTDFVRGLPNRAVIFDSPLFHARLPREGLGANDTEARLVHVTHFIL